MTVKELIEKLQTLSPDATVWMDDLYYGYSLVQVVNYDDVSNEVKLS